jgi:hypothetical protein
MLWIITYILVSYGEIEDFSVEGLFKGTQEEVSAYVKKRNDEISEGIYEYYITEMLN